MAVFFLFTLCFLGVFGEKVKTVKEGDSVTLNSDVPKHQYEVMRWYFNNIRIALIREDPSNSCLYDGEEGIFRDRLKMNYETGSLTITNITSEHAGYYEAEFIRKNSAGTSTSLNRNSTCNRTKIIPKPSSDNDDIINTFRLIVTEPKHSFVNGKDGESDTSSGLSAGVTAGIVAVVLLVFVAAGVVGVIYCRRRRSVERERNNRELL